MKLKKTVITTCLVFSMFTTLEAKDNVETTLEDLLTCKETWGSIFTRDLANGSKMNSPSNIKKIYLIDFNKQNIFYTPKEEMKLFNAKVVTFSTTAGTSPGVSLLLDIDFDTLKKNLKDKNQITFDKCRETKYSKSCTKKISNSKSFMILETGITETKKGVMVACASTYRR